jgi:hypothetical protein
VPTGSGRLADGLSEAIDPGAASKNVSTGTGAGPAPHSGWRGAGAVADASETGRAELDDGEVEAVWPQPSRPTGVEGSPEIVSTVTGTGPTHHSGLRGAEAVAGKYLAGQADDEASEAIWPWTIGPAGAEDASENVLTGTGAEPAHHSGLRGAEAVTGM